MATSITTTTPIPLDSGKVFFSPASVAKDYRWVTTSTTFGFGEENPEFLIAKNKTYSKEMFKKLTKKPLVKEIIPGLHKLTRTEAENRINESLSII